ncbi:formate--tetrahydrofolate ligase [Bartonella sp. HY329]|uniref:formate--tetrahydrofolate ligase n=1 Tax=unclassified Bartonella TaxID=2645622 RepID=UPI0021C8D72B|nr:MULTISPECIES: formate--tetrahydrofolate ligase [unclassified Bartonella]UXM94872.1 formate--tetrahydrofolate ligase [Bartonella sp. HY329]UXN09195.1 formate--tetrahydrofolate ligase [Bartonella sp. HY328]
MKQLSDIEIARSANKKAIGDIAAKIGLTAQDILPFGHDKAKLTKKTIENLPQRDNSHLILVTAINPTPAGEGKTTTSIGIADGLNAIGKKTMLALREPSLGPCFGTKGGAAGGGHAQLIPMEDINLHFTGDFHAITSAHNLLAALIDNHIYWGNNLQIDSRRIMWRRVMDINERALRDIVVGLGGVSNGFSHQSGFDITVASEIMAIFCLAESLDDLMIRLGNIVVAYNFKKEPIYARDLDAQGAMGVLLKDAFLPNLVQTLENNPALVHGGPFANIAHGCNSVIATKTALKLADYVVTEAGFGADLGAEKFLDIKCRLAKLQPSAIVIVATIRALKMNGGIAKADLNLKNIEAVRLGAGNLIRHINNMQSYGVPVIVAINHFYQDSDEEIDTLRGIVEKLGVEAIPCRHFELGSKGTVEIAEKLVALIDTQPSNFHVLYEDNIPLIDKINKIVTDIYGGEKAIISDKIKQQLLEYEQAGYGHFPVCMAKTQYSFSSDPNLRGAPSGFDIPVREIRLAAGAGFIVVICGEIMTMPGLPSKPAAEHIYLDNQGEICGLS